MDEMILSGADDGWDEETYSPLDTPPIDGVLGNTPTSSPQPEPSEEFRQDLLRMGLIPNEEAFLEMWGRFQQLASMRQRTPDEETEFDTLQDHLTQLQNDWQMEKERETDTVTVDSILAIMADLPNATSTPVPSLSPIPPTPPGSPPDLSPGSLQDSPPSTHRVQTTTTASTPQHRSVVGRKNPTRPSTPKTVFFFFFFFFFTDVLHTTTAAIGDHHPTCGTGIV
ncbi:hypothetical protein QZH41_006567 [Actinostola sp. cb2023]|nr:hypothetical protein QZH41_006567 [Actinostola sp. cb2023]